MGTYTKSLLATILLCATYFTGSSTAWTTSTAGPVNTLANWTDGSGSPTSFATPGDTWTVTMSMTLPASATWTVGTATMSAVTVTCATGGTISTSGAGSTFTIIIHGDLTMSGGTLTFGGAGTTTNVTVNGALTMGSGTLSLGGAGTTGNITVNGNIGMTGGTISSIASSTDLYLNFNGNYSLSGGTVTTTGASSTITLRTHGNFTMTGGSVVAGGAGGVISDSVYGNCSISGAAAMTNVGAGCTNELHLALHSSLGTMLIDNTSTGSWSGTNVFVDSNCKAQLAGNFSTTTGSASFGLTVNGTLICPSAYSVNGTRKFILNGIATLVVAHATGINGSITTTGTRTFSNSANYTFNGTAAQVTGSYMPATLVVPDTITISNSAGVTLSQTTATDGKLIFTSGILNTGTFTMSVPGTAANVSGAGATSYVNGTLIKTVTGLTTVNYEVGDLSYAPMSLALSPAGTSGTFALKVTNGLHPNVSTSGLLASNMANHYWTITNSASGPTSVTPTATYNSADILGGSNTAFATQKYTGSAWLGTPVTSTNTSSPYTTTPGTGILFSSVAGDYIFGNIFCGTLPITGSTAVCEGANITLADATPGGTWVSASTGVATISTSGVVTGVSGGTAVISYTVGTCTVTRVITVNPLPSVSAIAGSDTFVCVGNTITFTNATTGGTWGSTNTSLATVAAGIVTGVAPGIDTITYAVTNSCGTTTVKRRVRVLSTTACHAGIALTDNRITALEVYPNPNSGAFMLKVSSAINEEMHVVITDLLGKKVKEFITMTNKATEVRLENVPGVYLLSASGKQGRYVTKFVVE